MFAVEASSAHTYLVFLSSGIYFFSPFPQGEGP